MKTVFLKDVQKLIGKIADAKEILYAIDAPEDCVTRITTITKIVIDLEKSLHVVEQRAR